MDLTASCKEKLAYFRIKELKDVLTQLGLSKQGRKQDLVDRILSALRVTEDPASKLWNKKTAGKEDVAKLVDDIYRKMQVTGASDLASIGPGSSDCSNVKVKAEYDGPFHSETKVRCPCGTTLETDSKIQLVLVLMEHMDGYIARGHENFELRSTKKTFKADFTYFHNFQDNLVKIRADHKPNAL